MELSSKHVGVKIAPFETQVTWRKSMNFAASVGDNNACYFDDERPGGLIAPPLMAVSLTWPISEKFWEYADTGDFPFEVLQRQVHYTETLRWGRPIQPGERLSIAGEVAAILPHRGGTYLVVRYSATDAQGREVFAEDSGALLRGVRCVDGGRGAESISEPSNAGPERATAWEQSIVIDPLAAHIYDGCADIAFPIHTSPRFAHSVGLPGIILHGTATLAMAVRELVNREVDADPVRLKALECRFTGMVIPGSTIAVRYLGAQPGEASKDLFFEVTDAEGKKAISNGRLTVVSKP